MSKKEIVSLKGIVEYNQYWALEADVSNAFNRLKAKTHNLIEASIVDKGQQEALKGLIKGFANDEYRLCTKNMRFTAEHAGWLDKDQSVPESPEPLESFPG